MRLPTGVHLVLVDRNNGQPIGSTHQHKGELADFIYYNVRCAQSHDAELDYSYIDLERSFGIGCEAYQGDGSPLAPGLFVVSNATVLALILAVIASPENAGIRLPDPITLYGKVTLDDA